MNNLKPSVVVAFFHCGLVPSASNDGVEDVVIVGIESGAQTHYVRDIRPFVVGGAVHRLACAQSGFLLGMAVDANKLLGAPLLCELIPTQSFAALRTVREWPGTADRFKAPAPLKAAATSTFGFGFVEDDVNWRNRPTETHPPKPVPRSTPIRWSVTELTAPTLPADLPECAVQLVQRSSEWAALLNSKRGKAARC